MILAIAALAAASLAQAQPAEPVAQLAPAAADAGAPVPRPQYRSVFQDVPRGVEARHDDWRQANAEVGRFPRGHADRLKWEEAQGAAQAGSPSPRAPASAAAPAGHRH